MVTKEQEHRHQTEWFKLQHDAMLSKRGLNYALVVIFLFLVACAFFAVLGYATQGIVLGTIDLVALVTVFIVRRGQNST